MKDLLTRAAREIDQLRRDCEIMHAKISMIEMFDRVLHSNPPPRGGMISGVDIAWELRKKADEIDAGMKP